MEFDLSEDQRELRDAARRFLEREAPISYARAMMDDAQGYRPEVWKQMADLGWMALAIPEEHEGLGLGLIAQAILLAEMGRVVMPGPYLPTAVLAAQAIVAAGSGEQRARLLPRIAAGDVIATMVATDALDARRDGDRYLLDGEARFAPCGHVADTVVVATPDAMFLVNDGAFERRRGEWMDATRPVADLRFRAAPAEPLTADADALERLRDVAAVAFAAEMLGAAERVLELSVEYAKSRVQFGRPIGSFQAVKHRAADMLVDVESIRNAVYYAAWAVERGHADASLAASMAKACASDAAPRVAKAGIQIHGGVGFTWEHDMHLFFKRVKACEVAWGDAADHRERMATILRQRHAPTA